MVEMTDLVRQIRKKDEQAISLLYNRYGKKLYGFAVHKWQVNDDDAWELVYKTLYKIIAVIDRYTFENESKFNGFIYKVFINNLRNHYQEQKSKQMMTVPLEEYMGSGNKEEDTTTETPDTIYMQCLKKILEQLDDWKRILLLMKAQQFSYEEIASYVSRPADQLKVYYMRAKQNVTQKVNECVDKG